MRIVSHKTLRDFYEQRGNEDARVPLVKHLIVKTMKEITEAQYKFALQRVEVLLPQVDDSTPANDPKAVELTMMSDVVIEYEKEHFPIEKPTVAELIAAGLKEAGITQKQLAQELGLSTTRINDFVLGKSEPSLKIAGQICRLLKIQPAAMLML